MESIDAQDQQAIAALLTRGRERLDRLVQDLRGIDGELEALSTERQQYRLLHDACAALDSLAELGGAQLFWGERLAGGEGEEALRVARGRADAFQKRIDEIDERRQSVLEDIQRQEENVEILEDDLLEAQRREEQRKQEWVIEREIGPLPGFPSVMPWTRGGEDDDRFRKALAAALLLSLLLGLLMPLIDVPLPERWEVAEVPDRFTKLIREERPKPPPPPVQEQTQPEELEPDPTQEKPVVAEETPPKPTTQPTPQPGAESKGLLAFRENFAGLADEPDARLGAQARITTAGEAASGLPERSMVTTQAPGSSGGINLSSLSREVGGGGDQIAGVQVARATSSIGGVAGGEGRPRAGGAAAGRTDEEIQIVFDRHKAALYRLYNRELRRDPTLQGQMLLRLRIEPDGSVSLCEVQSSDMNAPDLAAQVAGRVRTFDFGAKEVPAVTILYPIDFLPAT